MNVSIEMPKYKCHKEVHALKIWHIEFDYEAAARENRETDGSATLVPANKKYAPVKVNGAFVRSKMPHEGGYYVIYEDGYASFSPAKEFEDGYKLVEP